MKNKPVLEKCLAFMSCFNPAIKTFDDFRNWVILNHKSGPDLMIGHPYGPYTYWEYQVPFLSSNSDHHRVCVTPFEEKYINIGDTNRIDEIFEMKLVHGFICAGCWGNGNSNYAPFLPDETKLDNTSGVYEKTIGVEFYFSSDRPHNSKAYDFYTKLFVICISLRVNDKKEIVCMKIATKTHFNECRGDTSLDVSYKTYTQKYWWDTPNNLDDKFYHSKDPELERYVHSEILGRLIQELSK